MIHKTGGGDGKKFDSFLALIMPLSFELFQL